MRAPSRIPRPARLAWCVVALALAGARAPAQPARPAAADPNVDPTTATEVIALWPGRAPDAVGDEPQDRPTLTVFRPWGRRATDPPTAAVIVAPGGGYGFLAANHEGRQVANWLNSLGLTAFVPRYRVAPRYRHPVPLHDAQRAIRLVRVRATEFGVRPDAIGMLGFSAGGHLTATAGTRFDEGRPDAADPIDRVGSRPDFLVLGYPVISFAEPYTHRGSARNLLGADTVPARLADLSAERNVTARTPPTFLVHTNEDTGVPAENSIAFYLALRKAGVPAELHVFERGPHGVGLAGDRPGVGEWPRLLAIWLRERGLIGGARP
jgi:acetyl esterase/lipase